jgi:hypothetical protein
VGLLDLLVDDRLLQRDFRPYGTIFMTVCCYELCHGNAFKGFWALVDTIYDYMLL